VRRLVGDVRIPAKSTVHAVLDRHGLVKRARQRRRFKAVGLSGILCVRPVSSLANEPFAEDDGELGLGLEPLARRPFPFLGSVVQNQI
jgi:hypothetical protein